MSANRDASSIDADLERQGLAFLHQARKVRDLDSGQVERIARRLHQPAARSPRALLWPALAAIALVMVAGATLAVAQGGLRALPIVGSLFSPTPAPKQAESRRGRGRALPKTSGPDQKGQEPETAPAPAASPQPTILPNPAPLPAAPLPVAPAAVPEPAPVVQPGKASAEAHREPPRTVALRDPSPSASREREPTVARREEAPARMQVAEAPIVAESRSFATVIESWHRQQDAGIALGLLDAYEQRYPAGDMRLEARILRAEIYLAQGQSALALSVLDGISPSGIPRARELQTLRGELRVKAGRCREAQADLGSVLEKSMTDALAKRATQALAHCP
jgi:hypothetical protein